ncbi:sperm-associated antigen 16 protein-like [Pseudochaenichthys georgianus]|uniref:sperm-associated antigen 16 protein-like n=1 Tax=Pseudochaenichthys georgianus TaxID=52239 RepID=UPI00146B1D43|nr:sperm-associated antigen 16 protein-like [Pseudochaenichthys georgianus]
MSADKKVKEKVSLSESEDGFQYEEVSLGDDWSLTEGEEDLEATVKAIQERAEAAAALRKTAPSTPQKQEAADDFLRTFLVHMNMTETLDCFQTEWTEMVQRGGLDTEKIGLVPQVYTENQSLTGELETAQREMEEYRRAAAAGALTLERVQRNRDFHSLQYKRVVQEKNKLIEEMKKLTVQCNNYEPEVKRMNEKYQTVLKQTMLVALEKDKALGEEGSGNMTHEKPPSPAKSARTQTR